MATSLEQASVLKNNLRRYALAESENIKLKHQLDFERAISQAHEIAAEKASKELEKLRKLISEIDALHVPCHESMVFCEDCGEEFPCQTRILLDGGEESDL
jgi:ABC-type phosphate transport system auxiliary subunit